MFDKDKVLLGLAVFACLATFPLWYTAANGKMEHKSGHTILTSENQCVESKEYMREYHMQLLKEWRDSVVRDGVRTYMASNGKEYDISLTDTCLKCHSNKADFCDKCHGYAGVSPNCYNCHNIPPQQSENISLRGTQ